MKKFFISFVLIISLLFNVFAEYASMETVHKELREFVETCAYFDVLKDRGLDLDKLDSIEDPKELCEYLSRFFIDENGYPLDNHAYIEYFNNGKKHEYIQRTTRVVYSDEYGIKDELLAKGYIENETMFYYPYFNGEWKDRYRVGKKVFGSPTYEIHRKFEYSINTKKSLFVGVPDFYEKYSCFNDIRKSKKDYLIIDLSYNGGGRGEYFDMLVKAIKKMKPKEIFVLCSGSAVSWGDYATLLIGKATNIKTTVIGAPTKGSWISGVDSKIFWLEDGYGVSFGLLPLSKAYVCKDGYLGRAGAEAHENYNLPYQTEGIGAAPDIYADSFMESLEIVKHLIEDEELSLPEDHPFAYYDRNGNSHTFIYSLGKWLFVSPTHTSLSD